MPLSITLVDVAYLTPDGEPLFEHLDLAFGQKRTGLIGRNGTGKSTLLRLIDGELRPAAGKIVRSGSIAMLRQHVQTPDANLGQFMGIASDLARLDRLEAGIGSDEDIADADWTLPARLEQMLARVGLAGLDLARPLASLSGGQQTRVAIAGAILADPDMLLLDEPTNNLDAEGRQAVAALLSSWKGGAIVVSHDRALLREMDEIVELTTIGARTYGGNWDHYIERRALDLAAAEHDRDVAERKVADIDRRIQAQVERKARTDSTGKKKRAKGGAPRILLNAMGARAQETSAQNTRLANRMRNDAAGAVQEAQEKIEILQPLTVNLMPTGLPHGRTLLQATGLAGGPLGDFPVITGFDFTLIGPERVAVTGPNGSGKTTLLRLLTGDLDPVAGSVRITGTWALLDQSVSILQPDLTIRDAYSQLNPHESENDCRAALARFMFRADAALQTVGSLSGGEMLRAGLAATIGGREPPQLLILDEPTNHLDVSAIEAVEAGLRAYDGALLVVSHDQDFLEAIGIDRTITLGIAPQDYSSR